MKKLSLSQYSDGEDINHYVLDAFPQLKGIGGYELLRASSGRMLEVIPHPPDGYSANYLKDVVQQAKIYIRPIQTNIPLDVAVTGNVSTYISYQA